MNVCVKQTSPCTCLNLRRAARAITEYYDSRVSQAGISISQLTLLRYAESGPATITELAGHMRIDRTTLNRNLKPLVEKGFIAVVPGHDSRTREIMLTDTGRRKLAEALILWAQVQHDVEKYLGAADVQKLTELTGKIETLHP